MGPVAMWALGQDVGAWACHCALVTVMRGGVVVLGAVAADGQQIPAHVFEVAELEALVAFDERHGHLFILCNLIL
jgi:hypothetical protein